MEEIQGPDLVTALEDKVISELVLSHTSKEMYQKYEIDQKGGYHRSFKTPQANFCIILFIINNVCILVLT
jgi:hypothetical protein